VFGKSAPVATDVDAAPVLEALPHLQAGYRRGGGWGAWERGAPEGPPPHRHSDVATALPRKPPVVMKAVGVENTEIATVL